MIFCLKVNWDFQNVGDASVRDRVVKGLERQDDAASRLAWDPWPGQQVFTFVFNLTTKYMLKFVGEINFKPFAW